MDDPSPAVDRRQPLHQSALTAVRVLTGGTENVD
jgi:hypothetical protein